MTYARLLVVAAISIGSALLPADAIGADVLTQVGGEAVEPGLATGSCFCATDPAGATFCFEPRSCDAVSACSSNADCPAGERCVVNTCCSAPKVNSCGLPCLDETCTETGPFSCGNNPSCEEGRPNGSACTDPAECFSGNCVDGVCCDTPCDGPAEACNLDGREGICTEIVAVAPATSHTGLLITVLILAALGVFAIVRRRQLKH